MRTVLILLVAATLSACATTGDQAGLDRRDPYEGFNRGVWGFNQAVDTVAIKPVTTVYRTVAPVPARRGITRIFANLAEPLSFINGLLQGKPDRAFNSLGRFLINSTLGVGGLADHATAMGMPETQEDFGQTLAVWGMRESPYLVLPLLGPTTVRDGVGTVVSSMASPVGVVLNEVGATATEHHAARAARIVDVRSQLIDAGVDATLKSSADPYAATRSAFFQRREAEIADQLTSDPGNLIREDEDKLLDQALDDPLTATGNEAPQADPTSPETPQPEPGSADPATGEDPLQPPL